MTILCEPDQQAAAALASALGSAVRTVDNLPDVTFGNFQTVTLSGLAFNDQNHSGSFDAGEPGIPGLTFDLVNAASGQTVAKVVSDSTGTFTFTNVGPIAPLAGSVTPGSCHGYCASSWT